MHITAKERIKQPIHNPRGEQVYELVGLAPQSGSAATHSLAHILIPPGKSSQAHYHKVSEETYYILHGVARMRVDGAEISLTPGEACLIEPFEVHQIFNAGETDLEFLAFCAPPWETGDSFYQD